MSDRMPSGPPGPAFGHWLLGPRSPAGLIWSPFFGPRARTKLAPGSTSHVTLGPRSPHESRASGPQRARVLTCQVPPQGNHYARVHFLVRYLASGHPACALTRTSLVSGTAPGQSPRTHTSSCQVLAPGQSHTHTIFVRSAPGHLVHVCVYMLCVLNTCKHIQV